MYENFKSKVTLKKLSEELRQNIYWGNFPDKEAFASETLGEHIPAEQLPNFFQTIDVCDKGMTLCFTKTETKVKDDFWKTTDYYFTIEANFSEIEKLLKNVNRSENAKDMVEGLQELLNQKISFVAEA
ncbi:hypothetical protein ACWOC1_10645 [Enterococcus quebecensis]|uniref:Uncharacterized protein n=1 Tax=Enterococcus quebecensis TaxID=903983 RepID=A0A1E5H1K2_9ENTE|nr:hypothetical protein [Enterococcus quebecensis]OEG18829.1 hypothetical protein BCR23_12870 [Enterococcus quebecensis]